MVGAMACQSHKTSSYVGQDEASYDIAWARGTHTITHKISGHFHLITAIILGAV